MDELAQYNQARWDELSQANVEYAKPLLELDEEDARQVIDEEGIDLIHEWIRGMAPTADRPSAVSDEQRAALDAIVARCKPRGLSCEPDATPQSWSS
ncbi:MAG: hypothetical protein HC802_07785, partial [Caldilineaceae bacterium]|nr:hypothetical protein [Caldilineaceae bacterium]